MMDKNELVAEEAQAKKQNLASPLTQGEQTILQLLTKGYTNQEIADALNISYQTAKNEVGSVLRKLGARHRTEAVIIGLREKEMEKNELIRKIVQVCASCPHFKGMGRYSLCDRRRSQCHSGRVRKWLKELEELEEKTNAGQVRLRYCPNCRRYRWMVKVRDGWMCRECGHLGKEDTCKQC